VPINSTFTFYYPLLLIRILLKTLTVGNCDKIRPIFLKVVDVSAGFLFVFSVTNRQVYVDYLTVVGVKIAL